MKLHILQCVELPPNSDKLKKRQLCMSTGKLSIQDKHGPQNNILVFTKFYAEN